MSQMPAPSEDDFAATFGVEPSRHDPDNGYWEYCFRGSGDSSTLLSFNTHEASVQTVTRLGGDALATVSCEGATRLWIDEDSREIRATFGTQDRQIEMVLTTTPVAQPKWSILRMS